METKLKVEGMTCEMCVKHVTSGLQNVNGVKSATVDLESATAVVEGENLDAQTLIEAVQEEGYDATVIR